MMAKWVFVFLSSVVVGMLVAFSTALLLQDRQVEHLAGGSLFAGMLTTCMVSGRWSLTVCLMGAIAGLVGWAILRTLL